MQAKQFFSSLPDSWAFREEFSLSLAPWEWLKYLPKVLKNFFNHCPQEQRIHSKIPELFYVSGDVFIGKNVQLPPFGVIQGPAYIDDNCELRPGIYIRGNVMTSTHCLLGNSCEIKQAILLDHVKVPHFNYVGDSILGSYSHLGAGSILSNLRFDKQTICIRDQAVIHETGLKKLGAIVGDHTEIGCNAVTQPGTCLFPYSKVYPVQSAKGIISNAHSV